VNLTVHVVRGLAHSDHGQSLVPVGEPPAKALVVGVLGGGFFQASVSLSAGTSWKTSLVVCALADAW